MKILTVYTVNLHVHVLPLKAHVTKSMLMLSPEICEASSTNSTDTDQIAPVGVV